MSSASDPTMELAGAEDEQFLPEELLEQLEEQGDYPEEYDLDVPGKEPHEAAALAVQEAQRAAEALQEQGLGEAGFEGPALERLRAAQQRLAEAERRLANGEELRRAFPRPLPRPVPPIHIRRHLVRGRYRSGGTGFRLELRVDVDGHRPLNRVSGDFFTTSGGTMAYFGSFIVHAPTIKRTAGLVTIEGMGTFTWSAGAPRVRVKIPRKPIVAPRGNATVQFIRTNGQPGASYTCSFVSPYFRSVKWEQDSVAGTVPFVSYNTGSLPQPPSSPVRTLTVPKAFAEAGLELQAAGSANVIPTGEAGADTKWNNSELHASMVRHFSTFKNIPTWQVWLVVATSYNIGGVRGVMFDHTGTFQRQGCAVFHDLIKGPDAVSQRAALRTYVHELGHAFNLLHSWQKNLANPPQPLGPNNGLADLSWMQYAQNYNDGQGNAGVNAYWAAFPFQFTNAELVHLRHGFYKNVIMGGSDFLVGAAEIDPEIFMAPIADESGLRLDLRSKGAFEFGEPVVVELKLSTTDLRGRQTHGFLHPADGFTSIALRQPSGRIVQFRPLMRRCRDEEREILLNGGKPAIYKSAYIGYGTDGLYFDQPGTYHIRAQYIAADGSRIVSDVQRLRVRGPLDRTEEAVGELMMGDQQGQLFALLGSDAPQLQQGNDALQEVIEKHAKHPLAVYARMVKGLNAERDFKIITTEKVTVRQADTKEAIDQLKTVSDQSIQGKGVDNITLNYVMRTLAEAEAKQGDMERATATLDRMVSAFESQRLRADVLDGIRDQAEREKARIQSRQ